MLNTSTSTLCQTPALRLCVKHQHFNSVLNTSTLTLFNIAGCLQASAQPCRIMSPLTPPIRPTASVMMMIVLVVMVMVMMFAVVLVMVMVVVMMILITIYMISLYHEES